VSTRVENLPRYGLSNDFDRVLAMAEQMEMAERRV
jgi:hypothetical protein